MKRKFKKKVQGAISIFLCIIFVSNYALIALLVDSARARMAKTVSESALDTASVSVLSYYNQMLYDLYGLFATDSVSQEEILNILNDYTQKTLGVVQVDESSVKSLIDTIEDSLGLIVDETEEISEFNLYDFQTDVQLLPDQTYSLANTAAVESQIIDHMKYRAPYMMADQVGGFMEKLKSLSVIKERMILTKEKLDITNSKKTLFEKADIFNNDVSNLKNIVNSYALNPSGDASIGNNMGNFASQLDAKFAQITESMEASKPKITSDSESSTDEDSSSESAEEYEVQMAQYKEELKNKYTEALNEYISKMDGICYTADTISQTRNTLRTQRDNIVIEYKGYISELESKLSGNENSENHQTVYAPEIQQAKSNCGKIISDSNILSLLGDFDIVISEDIGIIRDKLKSVAEEQIPNMVEGEINSISSIISSDSTAMQSIKNCSDYFEALYNISIDKSIKSTDVKEISSDANKAEKAAEEKTEVDQEEAEGARSLNEEDLVIEFEEIPEPEQINTLEGEINTDAACAMLDAGTVFIDKLFNVLDDARDSLYINEYAIAYFPNFVQHYSAKDKPIATEAKNDYLTDEDKYYSAYNASLAEVEYILTGKNEIITNMADISSRILFVRMLFNTAAIFTDTGKVNLANAIASPSGPFAPLVTGGILIAWALAESVLDTACLLNGDQDVPLFKQGGNWKISVEGAFNELVSTATEYVVGEVSGKLTELVNQTAQYATQKSNEIIYNVYTQLDEGVQSLDSAKNQINQWLGDINTELVNQGAAPLPTEIIMSTFDQQSEKITTFITEDSQQAVIGKINTGIENVNKSLVENIQSLSQDAQKTITESVSKALNKAMPTGNITPGANNTTGLSAVKMNYMDYIRIFLLTTSNTSKVQRIQQLIQANIRYAENEFSMSESYISVASRMDVSIDFMLLAIPVLPENIYQDGRMKFSVYSFVGY